MLHIVPLMLCFFHSSHSTRLLHVPLKAFSTSLQRAHILGFGLSLAVLLGALRAAALTPDYK
jgi:hypothetical protein